MTRAPTKPQTRRSAVAAACLAVSLSCGAVSGSTREPATRVSCICLGGATVEWIEGSGLGLTDPGRLDWHGPEGLWRCRPHQFPVGAPGQGLRITTSPSNAPLPSEL